jgi:hypothetical protein
MTARTVVHDTISIERRTSASEDARPVASARRAIRAIGATASFSISCPTDRSSAPVPCTIET